MRNITENVEVNENGFFQASIFNAEVRSLSTTEKISVFPNITVGENNSETSAAAASDETAVPENSSKPMTVTEAVTISPNSENQSGVQMPSYMLVILIAAVVILGAVTVFLAAKLKKSSSGGTASGTDLSQNINDGSNDNKDNEAGDKVNIENIRQNNSIPVTVTPNKPARNAEFCYAIGNVHNQGRREEQQDSFCISDIGNTADLNSKGLMAVVADGMGGLESGASVSQLVSNIFLSRYRTLPIEDHNRFLYDTVMEAEAEVDKYILQNNVDGGSTLVAVMIRSGLLSFISVGDSFIFLIRGGQLIKLNTEHTYGNMLRERAARGEIDAEEAEINPKRNSLTSYIGIGDLRLINQSNQPIPVMNGDIIVLCSDGVYNALGNDAMVSVILGGDFSEAAERLEQTVLMQNLPTQDNFTAVLIQILGG